MKGLMGLVSLVLGVFTIMVNGTACAYSDLQFRIENDSNSNPIVVTKGDFYSGNFYVKHKSVILPKLAFKHNSDLFSASHSNTYTEGEFKINSSNQPNDYCLIKVRSSFLVTPSYYAHLEHNGQYINCDIKKVDDGPWFNIFVTDKAPVPAVGKLVKVDARPIITATTESSANGNPIYHKDYRLTITSGTLPGVSFFDYDNVFDDDLFAYDVHHQDHYFQAFRPYFISGPSDQGTIAATVVPVTGLLIQKNKVRGGMVSFGTPSQVLYQSLHLSPDNSDNGAIAKTKVVQTNLNYEKTATTDSPNKFDGGFMDVNDGVAVLTDKNPQPQDFTINGDISLKINADQKTQTIYNNGLNQAKIDIILSSQSRGDISPDDASYYGDLYHHIFFVQCQTSDCSSYHPITGIYNNKQYLSVNSNPGPYVGRLGYAHYRQPSDDVAKSFYISGLFNGVGDHTVYIAPMLCANVNDPSQPDVKKTECTGVTNSVITLKLAQAYPAPSPSFGISKSTLSYPQGDAAFKIADGSETGTTLSPLVFSQHLQSAADLGYPLLYSMPQFYVPQAAKPMTNQNGGLVNFNSDFANARKVTLHIADIFGNLLFKETDKQ